MMQGKRNKNPGRSISIKIVAASSSKIQEGKKREGKTPHKKCLTWKGIKTIEGKKKDNQKRAAPRISWWPQAAMAATSPHSPGLSPATPQWLMGAEDDEDINCEISSLLVLAMCAMRQQELPGVLLAAPCAGEDAGAEASQPGSATAAPHGRGCRAGADGHCTKAGDGCHPRRWSLPAERRPNPAQVRCELLPCLPPAAADAAGQGAVAAAGEGAKHWLLSHGPSEK